MKLSELKQHYEEGWTVHELARKTNLSIAEIRDALRHDYPEVHPTKEFRDDQVSKLHSEGMTDKEVADELIQRIAKGGYTVGGLTLPDPSPTHDPVNSPAHYNQGDIECIDAIKAALTDEEYQGYLKGNAFKYVWRSRHKGKPSEDIKKAIWYLNRSIGGEA